MRRKTNVFYFFCDDGLMLRYEPPLDGNDARSIVGKEPGDLAAILERLNLDAWDVGTELPAARSEDEAIGEAR